jgi:nucleoid DNA-binding protein
MANTTAKPLTKSEVYKELADKTGLERKQVAALFDELSTLIKKNVSKKGAGVFSLPGLVKLKVIEKKATKARKGINPFTKEEVMFKAKPARRVVKVVPLKALKDSVNK